MGGLACKEWNVVRANKDQFLALKADMKNRLNKISYEFNNSLRFSVVKSIGNKETFGDMDVVVSVAMTQAGCHLNLTEELIACFDPIGVVKNGNVVSMAILTTFGPFQVDFIRVESNQHSFALNYFNFNDLGNLLGRVYHKAGFKLGWEGLTYVIRNENNDHHVFKEVLVTSDWDLAMQFMGYANYFYYEFDTLEDVFEYTISTPYFNKDIYLLENRNHTSRVRDAKRPTYTAFLKWLKDSEEKGRFIGFEYSWSNKKVLHKHFLDKARREFPYFDDRYELVLQDIELHNRFKEKFNGDLVSEWTGLKGKELGNFIKDFKLRNGGDFGFMDYILNCRDVEASVRDTFYFDFNRIEED